MTLELEALRNALIKLDAAGAGESTSSEAPVFVAGTLWRCGSTLVQRIIMSDPRVLIWGEPIEDRATVERLVESMPKPRRGPSFWIGDNSLSELQTSWTTLLWPDAADFKAGQRAMFDTWLGAPARRRGFEQWGVKEVRWSGSDIMYLRWLFPASAVFLVVRDPVQAYQSLCNYYFKENRGYYIRWPEIKVLDAKTYAMNWNKIVLNWVELRNWERYQIVRYEDLIAGKVDIQALGANNGLSLDGSNALAKRVNRGIRDAPLDEGKARLIMDLTAEAREQLDRLR